MSFRPRRENELAKLSDDDLVAYLVAATDAGHDTAVVRATGILIWRRRDVQYALIRAKVGSDFDAEEILQIVFEHAMKVPFRGRHTGEFFSLLNVIRERRVADYHKKKSGSKEDPRSFDQPGDDDKFLPEIAGDEDIAGEITTLVVYQQLLEDELPRDRALVEMKIDGYPSKEVAERINERFPDANPPMTFANVDTIYHRFKKKARRAFGEGGEES